MMPRLLTVFFALLLLALPALAQVAPPQPPQQAPRPVVVASTRPLAGIVFDLAGDAIQLRLLQPEQGDIHAASLTPAQLDWLDKADLIILNGLGLDRAVEEALASRRFRARVIHIDDSPDFLALMRRAPGVQAKTAPVADASSDSSAPDPHWWFSALNQIAVADHLTGEFIELLPQHAATFQQRLLVFTRDMVKLDTQWQAAFAPYRKVPVASLHDAWHYLTQRFELKEIALIGADETQAQTPRRQQAIRQLLTQQAPVCLVAGLHTPGGTVKHWFNSVPAVLTTLDEDGSRLPFGTGFSHQLLQSNYGKLYDCLKAVADEGKGDRKADTVK